MKWSVAVLMFVPLLAGCLQDDGPDEGPGATVDSVTTEVLFGTDTIDVTVPTDVYLIGFSADEADALQEALDEDEVMEHVALDYSRALPDSPEEKILGGDANIRWPWTLHADFRVHDIPDGVEAAFFASVADHTVDVGVHDGNHALAWLAQELPAAGYTLDINRTGLVLVDGQGALGPDHAYRFTGGDGYLQPVRLIDTVHPIIMYDVSATPDPYAGSARDYDQVLASTDTTAIADLVRDITHFRLLHSPIYPVATTECHAVTLILGVRSASLTAVLPDFSKPEDVVDAERMEARFENLTRDDNVFVDLVFLELPQDDPVLDLVSRESADLDAFRYWLDENWDQYWVEHPGCEPYVSFALYGDAFDQEATFSGIAMYDVDEGHRISFSIVSDQTRLQSEWNDWTGVEQVDDIIDAGSVGRADNHWFHRLFSHETGHLFSMAHPHNAIEVDGQNYNGFSSVQDTMSYQVRGVTDDFGTATSTNFLRNRAGWLLGEAVDQGLEGTAAFDQAVAHLERFEWQAAGDILVPVVQ